MSNIKELIKEFLTGDSKEVGLPMTPISQVEEILEEHGYEAASLNGDETNGWEIDFWYYFYNSVAGPKLCLSGSLHYGNFKLTKG